MHCTECGNSVPTKANRPTLCNRCQSQGSAIGGNPPPDNKTLLLTKQEVFYLLSAVWNYDGAGPPRPEVLSKLKDLVTLEDLERVWRTYGPRPKRNPWLDSGDA